MEETSYLVEEILVQHVLSKYDWAHPFEVDGEGSWGEPLGGELPKGYVRPKRSRLPYQYKCREVGPEGWFLKAISHANKSTVISWVRYCVPEEEIKETPSK